MYHTDALHPVASLEGKLQHLYTLHKYRSIDLGFRKPYLDLLQKLGNPHLRLPPVIHVAGTNGKGSTVAFMRAILEAAGYRVHVYTSPHLVKFNERIVLAGRPIDDGALEALLDEAVTLNDGGEVTFFEVTTAMAFAAFARTPADIVLLEVGLGGRLDCTNVIRHPAATVITPIGYDHMEFLGETLDLIAIEKAGIMKPGAPCIVAPQVHDTVIATLRAQAADRGVPISCAGAEWRIETVAPDRHEIESGAQRISFPRPSLTGKHQICNAATAIRVLSVLNGFDISQRAVDEGVTRAAWAGRLQRLHTFQATALPAATELWIDGAHNEPAVEALAGQLAAWQAEDGKPLHLLVGMLNRRSPAGVVKPLLPYARTLSACAIPGEPQSHSPDAIRQAALGLGFPQDRIRCMDDPFMALSALAAEGPGRILVLGSLYLAGAVLKRYEGDAISMDAIRAGS